MLKPGERAPPLILIRYPPVWLVFLIRRLHHKYKHMVLLLNLRVKRPLFKVDKYNGSTSLETHLLQFRQLATYLQWTERDTFYIMCASLSGPAARVLWELPKGATTDDLTRLLQVRFVLTSRQLVFELNFAHAVGNRMSLYRLCIRK